MDELNLSENYDLMKINTPIGLFLLLFFATQLISLAQAPPATGKMIARIWHGRTKTSIADEYYMYLKEAGLNKMKAIEGNLGLQVLRRTEGEVTHFTVISYWESLDVIHKFAGEDIEKTHHLPKDPLYLLELEPNVVHHEVVMNERRE